MCSTTEKPWKLLDWLNMRDVKCEEISIIIKCMGAFKDKSKSICLTKKKKTHFILLIDHNSNSVFSTRSPRSRKNNNSTVHYAVWIY